MSAIAQAHRKVGTSVRTPQRGVPTVTLVRLVFVLVFAFMLLNRVATAEDRRSQTAATAKIAAGTAATAERKAAFVFGGVDYFHRWSGTDQHEFTPTGQDNLEKWTDMITINLYSSAHDGDALAVKANAVLENYKNHVAPGFR